MNKQTAALLEKHFDTAFAAPNGIAKLRELILTLAMQGKLVEQDPNDQPASELLKEIEAEKQRLIKEKKIKKPKALPEITADEIPYKLPASWKWIRITDSYFSIGSKQNQIKANQYLEKGNYPVIDQGKKYIAGYFDDEKHLLEIDRPIIIFGDHTKYIKYIDFNFIIGADGVKALAPYKAINSRYLYFSMKSLDLSDRGYARHFKILNDNLIALPPLNEQHRIVTKIDELMARCDKLEQLRSEQEQKRLDVHQAVIQQLLNEPQSNAWGFIKQHFNALYSVKENVEELRKAILQLAVIGHLVPNKGTIKVKYLKDLTTKIGSGSTPSGGKSAYKETGIPLIRSMNVHFEGFKYDGLAFIDEKQAEKLKGVYVYERDVLLNITGASIGRVALAPKEMEGARVNQHVCILRVTDKILPEYLQIYLSSPVLQDLIQDVQTGATREALTKTMIEKFEIQLPSIQAQRVAIAKTNELMILCNQLEVQIDHATAKQTELLDAVLATV